MYVFRHCDRLFASRCIKPQGEPPPSVDSSEWGWLKELHAADYYYDKPLPRYPEHNYAAYFCPAWPEDGERDASFSMADFDVLSPTNIPSGVYTVHYKFEVGGAYMGRDWQGNYFTNYSNLSSGLSPDQAGVLIISVPVKVTGSPAASFTYTPPDGEAPLTVSFIDKSTVPLPDDPITSRHWDFGDGQTSQLTNPVHTYETHGDYKVTLTVSNGYGPSTADAVINVFKPPPTPAYPAFKDSWFPNEAWVGQNIDPLIRIKNEGGPGPCYIRYTIEGQGHTLVDSVQLDQLQEYVWQEQHPIEWWLGYKPAQSRMVTIDFETGPVGEDATSSWGKVVTVYVEEPHEPTYCCPYCDACFYTKTELDAHIASEHPGEEPPDGGFPWVAAGVGLLGVSAALGAYYFYRRSKEG